VMPGSVGPMPRLMVPLKPVEPVTRMPVEPEPPAWIDTLLGLPLIVKSVTCTFTIAECDTEPSLPITVIG
jgi:hypothetical protein